MNPQMLTGTEQMISNIGYVIVVVIFLFYATQLRKQRAIAKQLGLPKTQRMRTVVQQWIDPLVIILVAGVILYQDLVSGSSHVIAAIVGLAIGLGFGWVRGRLEYVRYVPEHNAMILKITVIEVVMILSLVVIKVILDSAGAEPNGILMVIVSAVIFLDVGDSVGKSAHLTRRFRQDEATHMGALVGDTD